MLEIIPLSKIKVDDVITAALYDLIMPFVNEETKYISVNRFNYGIDRIINLEPSVWPTRLQPQFKTISHSKKITCAIL